MCLVEGACLVVCVCVCLLGMVCVAVVCVGLCWACIVSCWCVPPNVEPQLRVMLTVCVWMCLVRECVCLVLCVCVHEFVCVCG